MNSVKTAPKAAIGVAAIGIASALTGSILLAAPAFAAAPPVVGEVSVALDFSVAGQVDVDVNTKNLSEITAYGSATVTAPDGQVYDFSPRRYAPGEVWVYSTTLVGYTCDDLDDVSAQAFGFADLNDDVADWTTGVITYPDSRVTVIGCTVPTSAQPTETTAAPSPSTSTSSSPSSSPSASTSSSPSTSPSPSSSTGASAAPGGSNSLPPSMTDGALLVSATNGQQTSLGASLLLASTVLLAAAAGLVIRGRRLDRAHSE